MINRQVFGSWPPWIKPNWNLIQSKLLNYQRKEQDGKYSYESFETNKLEKIVKPLRPLREFEASDLKVRWRRECAKSFRNRAEEIRFSVTFSMEAGDAVAGYRESRRTMRKLLYSMAFERTRRRVAVSPTRNDCRRGMDRIKLRIS